MPSNEFILLLGKAFLHELNHGEKIKAIAFGRALLAEIDKNYVEPNGQNLGESQSVDSTA